MPAAVLFAWRRVNLGVRRMRHRFSAKIDTAKANYLGATTALASEPTPCARTRRRQNNRIASLFLAESRGCLGIEMERRRTKLTKYCAGPNLCEVAFCCQVYTVK